MCYQSGRLYTRETVGKEIKLKRQCLENNSAEERDSKCTLSTVFGEQYVSYTELKVIERQEIQDS